MKDLAEIEENLSYYDGSIFWESAIIPRIEERTESDRQTMKRVRRLFQTANKCKEVVVRHRTALLGRTPSWKIVDDAGKPDTSDFGTRASEIMRRLYKRWRRNSIGRYQHHSDPFKKALDDCLVTGFGYLRLYSDLKYASLDNANPLKVDLHSPDPNVIEVIRGSNGNTERIEYHFILDKKNLREVQEIRDDGATVFYWLNQGGDRVPMDDAGTEEIVLQLGGLFTVFELKREALITDTVKKAQNAINHALTMGITNIEFAGFLQQVILNGLPPGKWEENDEGVIDFVASEDWYFAPGRTNFVSGLPLYKSNGDGVEKYTDISGYTQPQVANQPPVDIKPIIDEYRLSCSVIYESANQSHILGQDQTLSGISREQLRADFKSTVQSDKEMVEIIIADCYLAALRMLLGYDFTKFDIEVDLLVDLGSPSPEERKQIREDYAAGLLSRVTAIGLQGYVDSPEVEASNIDEESKINVNTGMEAADIIDLPTPPDDEEIEDEQLA